MNPSGYKTEVLFSPIWGIEHKEVQNRPHLVVMPNNYGELDSKRLHVFRYKDGTNIEVANLAAPYFGISIF
jgi:hypothetical protein